MSSERLFMVCCIVGIFCVTGLITHCTYSIQQCRSDAIKAGMKAEDIRLTCRSAS